MIRMSYVAPQRVFYILSHRNDSNSRIVVSSRRRRSLLPLSNQFMGFDEKQESSDIRSCVPPVVSYVGKALRNARVQLSSVCRESSRVKFSSAENARERVLGGLNYSAAHNRRGISTRKSLASSWLLMSAAQSRLSGEKRQRKRDCLAIITHGIMTVM